MAISSLRERLDEWLGMLVRRGNDEPAADPDDVVGLRQQADAAVVRMDTTVRSAREESELASSQLASESLRRLREAVAAAHEISLRAFDEQRAAAIARDAGADDDERVHLMRLLDLAERAERRLTTQQAELERLRDLRAQVPTLLDELTERADQIEDAVPTARQHLEELRADQPEAALASVSDNITRATTLVAAARELVASGRAHLTDDRALSISAARSAERALEQAGGWLAEVGRAREALASADEDVRQALNSIHEDLRDVRRLDADDAATRMAVERAQPVIDAANAARRHGGDLLTALRELEQAEADLDQALTTYREAAVQVRREGVRLERRLRNATAYLAGIERRLALSRGGVSAASRSQLHQARQLVAAATAQVTTDPPAATAHLDQAMSLGRQVQATIESLPPVHVAGSGIGSDYVNDTLSEGLIDALIFGGIFGASRLGGGGSSSEGFGGGSRF